MMGERIFVVVGLIFIVGLVGTCSIELDALRSSEAVAQESGGEWQMVYHPRGKDVFVLNTWTGKLYRWDRSARWWSPDVFRDGGSTLGRPER